MKLSSKQQIAITTAVVNVLLLTLTLGAFMLFTKYLLEKNLNNDLLVEAEEIVTQHLNLQDGRLTYVNDNTNHTLEQDLFTDRLSAMIVNQDSSSIGNFGVFTTAKLPPDVETKIKTTAKQVCATTLYTYQTDQQIVDHEYTYIYYPIIKNGTCSGTIVVAGDTNSITAISSLTLSLSVIAIATATVLNLLVGSAIATRILKPLHQLSARMQQVNLDNEPPSLSSPYSRNDEISALIETFNAMAKRVNETSSTQRSFIVDASHELKTPIARAVTDLDIIKLSLVDTHAAPELIETLDQAQSDLKSIAEIINTMLQATKLKQVSLSLNTISLAHLVMNEIQELEKSYTTSQIEIHSLLTLEHVLADKQVITIILRNCLVNAFKYNIPHGSISISAEVVGNTYTVKIENTTSRDGEALNRNESYKLGFNIIQNLCSIAGYEFTGRNHKGHYIVTISDIPKANFPKR